MGIFYLLSVVLLIIGILLFKKTENKQNFISSLCLTIIGFICYQAIIAYFLDLVKIPISLLTMSILNTAIFAVLIGITIYKKQIQKYTIKKQDIIFLIIMLVVNVPILYKEFGILDNFRYTSTDAMMHCQAAITFSKGDFLLDSMTNWEAVNPTFMIAGYVNSGMIMKALVGITGEFNLYKIHMFMDLLYYFMIGYVFYLLLTSSKKAISVWRYILAYVISIIFMIGYPLNSVITGFHYFTLGILEVITIIYAIKRDETQGHKATYILLFLLNTGIMLTYNLFAPIIYVAEFIYFIYQARTNKQKIFSKKFILKILAILVIPGIIGVSFFILPRILENIVLKNQQQLWIDGYIYKNFWSNMYIFIPFAIYYIIKRAKDNKMSIETVTFLTICAVMILFYLGWTIEYVSTYYFMKLYYLLNFILLVLFYRSLCLIAEKGKIGKVISSTLIIAYSAGLMLNLIFVNVSSYAYQEEPETFTKIYDVYNTNKGIMKYVDSLFVADRMDVLEYIFDNNLIQGQNLLYVGDYVDQFMFKMFFSYENRTGIDKSNKLDHIQKWNNGEYDYLVIFFKSIYIPYYMETKGLELENGKIIFETPNCVIYEYAQAN